MTYAHNAHYVKFPFKINNLGLYTMKISSLPAWLIIFIVANFLLAIFACVYTNLNHSGVIHNAIALFGFAPSDDNQPFLLVRPYTLANVMFSLVLLTPSMYLADQFKRKSKQ
jgi:hypothetical protein